MTEAGLSSTTDIALVAADCVATRRNEIRRKIYGILYVWRNCKQAEMVVT